MPKGRSHAPPTQNDGIWFHHRGVSHPWPPVRTEDTSTGVMNTAPFKPFSAAYPPSPPKPYTDKNTRNFKLSNNFSSHDNRHSFQDHGVYLGNGRDTRNLGKRLTAGDFRQHHTDKEYLKHDSCDNRIYHTSYVDNFQGVPTLDPPKHRRFPKIHQEGIPGDTKLSTTTTSWYRSPDVPHKTPTQVLAISQEPFLGHNSWKYSNHGLAKCYPSYDKVYKDKPYPTWLIHGELDELKA